MNEVIKQMEAHRSIRSYTDQAVSDQQVEAITRAARWASTSNHVQSYTVIVIKDSEKKRILAELTGGQSWVEQCPVFFVICVDYTRQKYASEKHQMSFDVGGAEQLLVGAVDAALVAQNMQLAAESLGLGGVMIGGIRNHPDQVSDLLGLPDFVFPLVGLTVGHPDQLVGQKPRLPQTAVVHYEGYNADHVNEIEQYDQEMEQYYHMRTNGARQTSWTALMATYTETRKRPHMDAYLKNKGFLQAD
ncbi:oxygen-insensitive NADPH nitroreductase [Amphibacillus cookii]|uniref:oxygen-insensitive NADPH nitroreductase n=1 Tax=Amphibacillus cookii TaxID=767787 RepID=UPI0019591DDC|nr:oxygen-insensitive NADPH nitroreductase [Amphibacillus cookii]MBM7541158.1 nitroreductase [Amphibacillus cookii]